ncbi:MAG: hypothetical protein IV100_25055 [Myxococcales bacterium]|nr:hypothetical protein [Myxococcales bacterium]
MNRSLLLDLGAVDVTTMGILPESQGGADVSELVQELLLSQSTTIGRSITSSLDLRAQSFGGTLLYFPEGRYRFSRGVRVPADAIVRFIGDGEGRTIFELGGHVPSGATHWPIGPAFDDGGAAIPPPYPPPHLDNVVLPVRDWRLGSPRNSIPIDSLWKRYLPWVEERFLLHFCGMNRLSSYAPDFADQSWTKSAYGKRGFLVGGDGQSPWTVEDITFQGGGILVYGVVGVSTPILSGKIAGGHQRAGTVARCTFIEAPAWALATDGERVVNVDVVDCTFLDCNAGIGVRYAQSDLWRIADCSFFRTRTIDIQIASSNVTVDGCTFDSKPVDSRVFPFIQLKNMPDFLALGPGSDHPTAGWNRTERPAAAYLLNSMGVVSDLVYRTTSVLSQVPWAASMMIAGGLRIIDCTFGTLGGWATDAIVIGRWGTGDVPYPHDYGWPGTGDPEQELPPTLDGLRLAPDGGRPDIVARGIVVEGCRFGPLESSFERPRSALRLTVPVQDLCVIRPAVGDVAHVIYEEHSTRVWLDCLMAAAAQTLGLTAVAPTIFGSTLAQAGQHTRGNVLEWLPARLITEPPFALTESFSLGGFGFDVVGRNSHLGPPVCAPDAGGNYLVRSDFLRDDVIVIDDANSNFSHMEATAGSGVGGLGGAPLYGDPHVNFLFTMISVDGESITSGGLTCSFRIRRRPGSKKSCRISVTLSMGLFVLAGSFNREIIVDDEWRDIVVTVPTLPTDSSLRNNPPWHLTSKRNMHKQQSNALSNSATWQNIRIVVQSSGLSLFTYTPSSNGALPSTTVAMAATIYLRPQQGSAVEVQAMSVDSGAGGKTPWSRGNPDSNRTPNWKSVALEDDVIEAGFDVDGATFGTSADAHELDDASSVTIAVGVAGGAVILRDGSQQ